MTNIKSWRIEKDSIGEIKVAREALWGSQTERSRLHFMIGHEKMPPEVIEALVLIKKAAALVHSKAKVLPQDIGAAIVVACDALLQGHHQDQFPLHIWQTGSGTQTNMNVNEVVANGAIDYLGGKIGSKMPVHPNDHVNLSQSTNDVFPAAMHMASYAFASKKLLPALRSLSAAFKKKAEEFHSIIKIGRTHLMDAAPITLGQEFSGYVAQVKRCIASIEQSIEPLLALPLGGTAVGTGLNAIEGFGEKAAAELAGLTGYAFYEADNKFAAMASHEPLLRVSGSLKELAVALIKIANDIRWMGSGPRCGLGELVLPSNEPGSSIMPGKVNPTQCEAVTMVCAQVIGHDSAITFACSQGNFELNVYKPLIIYNLINSMHLLRSVMNSFEKHCIEGIKPNYKQMEQNVSRSLMLATALNQEVGYDTASQIVKKAENEGLSLKEAAAFFGVSAERFDAIVDVTKMVGL